MGMKWELNWGVGSPLVNGKVRWRGRGREACDWSAAGYRDMGMDGGMGWELKS